MKKQAKILIPSYAEDFTCIGGECEDSCCIGWDIDIDKITFRKYFRTKNAEMKKKFVKHIYRNEESDCYDVDYGRVAINDAKWCPFLDKDKYCEIYRNLGEDYLSNVCYSFPRVYNILNGNYELSLYMSCPEAVRKLLSSRDPITFIERQMPEVKHIIHSAVDTGEKRWNKSHIRKLPQLRSLSIETIQDRSCGINERLLNLGRKLENIAQRDPTHHDPIRIKSRYAFRIEYFRYVIESLGVFDEIDSPVFASFTSLLMEGFELSHEKSLESKADLYREVVETVVKPFTEENGYVFEHYLVNSIYQDNFPFSENQDMFDGYVMLVVRFALVQFYLAGIAARNRTLTVDDVAQMIQIHTKIINHHKTFILNLLQEIKRKQFDNMEFISLLLE
ncbi:MAG: flagellin lysine-N-methylase [Spirochaetaceae bacterium]|nr:flagellin lysine-N-methylase [Spirochaetaceae bacterium]